MDTNLFRYEKLVVWQKAIEFADLIYSVTEKFPKDERFGLTNQMRRAAVSISSNIAEGAGRMSDSDNARFIEISYGSLMEVTSQAHIAYRRQFLMTEDLQRLRTSANEIAKLLSGLRQALKPRF